MIESIQLNYNGLQVVAALANKARLWVLHQAMSADRAVDRGLRFRESESSLVIHLQFESLHPLLWSTCKSRISLSLLHVHQTTNKVMTSQHDFVKTFPQLIPKPSSNWLENLSNFSSLLLKCAPGIVDFAYAATLVL